MALINIPSTQVDPNYRYKMPKLMSKIEGRGNGIKTNIMNMADIAKALKRPPEYPTKFCGHELGAPTKFEQAEGKSIVNGAHEMKDLQLLIDKFVEKYVLCPNCILPEIDIVLKRGLVMCVCNACGHSGQLDNAHKLASYIVKYPPKGADSTMGKKGKKIKKEKKYKDKEQDDDAAADIATQENSEKSKVRKKKKSSKMIDVPNCEDEGKNGSEDSGSEVVKKKTSKSKVVKRTVDKDTYELDKLSYDSAAVMEVKDRLQSFVSVNSVTADEFFSEARALQVSQGFDSIVRLFITLETFFDKEAELTVEKFAEKQSYIVKVIEAGMDTTDVCVAMEDYMEYRGEGKFSEYELILHKLYLADCLEEKMLIKRYGDVVSGTTPQHTKAKRAAKRFIEWLRMGDSEGGDGDSKEEDAVAFEVIEDERQCNLVHKIKGNSEGEIDEDKVQTTITSDMCGSKSETPNNDKDDEDFDIDDI